MASAFKIAIVGSGPAGLSAAARAAQLGLSHVLLEKTDHLSDTIYKYQKGKHVMATPSQLVLRSDMDFEAGKREAVLGTWDEQAAEHKVNVRLNAEVEAIAGQKGDFTLTLTNGEEVKAEIVILAIGTQGNPNLMRCPVGDGAHRPVPARRSRRICRRAYRRDRRRATPASRMRSASPPIPSSATPSPSSTAAPSSPAPRRPTSTC